jgi:hypothetical protein
MVREDDKVTPDKHQYLMSNSFAELHVGKTKLKITSDSSAKLALTLHPKYLLFLPFKWVS